MQSCLKGKEIQGCHVSKIAWNGFVARTCSAGLPLAWVAADISERETSFVRLSVLFGSAFVSVAVGADADGDCPQSFCHLQNGVEGAANFGKKMIRRFRSVTCHRKMRTRYRLRIERGSSIGCSLQSSMWIVAERNPGSVTLRRLNRSEYRNTVRDLVGIDFEPADDFPGDDVGYGFDNIGDVLTLPPILMEKYLCLPTRLADEPS